MNVLRALPFFAVLLTALPAAAEPLDATTRDFDQLHLDLSVEPDLHKGTVDGTAKLTFAALDDGFRRLRLHSRDTTVLCVTDSKGRLLGWKSADGILSIDLAAELAKGAIETVAIAYRSKPTSGLWFHAPTKEHPHVPLSVYSQGQGTNNRHWIPCYDLPDDRLTLATHVTAVDPARTIANGVFLSEDYNGTLRTDHWELDQRIPTYLITLAVGPYEYWVEEGTPFVEYFAFPGDMPAAKHALGRTREMIGVFEKVTGAKYPYDRYAQVFVWDFLFGGMENATATTLNMRALHGPETEPNYTAETLVAHELAHQWFGDHITCRTWHHMWLNEGFATYFADLWFEAEYGREEFLLRRMRQNERYRRGTPKPEELGLERSPRGDLPLELGGGKAYSRGAAILHMLRAELGEKTFWKAIRAWAKEHADSAVTTEQFRRTVEAAAGRDLAWFFDQWVYGAGYPRIEVSWSFDSAAASATVRVRQTQPEKGGQGTFRFLLPLVVHHVRGKTEAVREVFAREHVFKVHAPGPTALEVDPEETLLAEIRVEQHLPSWWNVAKDGEPTSRIRALREVVTHGARGETVLRERLEDACYAVRVEAARQLGKLRYGAHSMGVLLDAARSDADPRVRLAAWDGVGMVHESVLQKVLAREKHPYVRAAIARAVGRAHQPGSYGILESLLGEKSHREVVVHGALDGLRILGDPRGIARATPYLDYKWGLGAMSQMRHAALNLILALDPDSPETHAAVISLLSDPYFRMRAWAAEACGTYGIRDAIPALTKMRDGDVHWDPRWAAKKALEALETDSR